MIEYVRALEEAIQEIASDLQANIWPSGKVSAALDLIEGKNIVGLSVERQLELLESRHMETLRFIDAVSMRIRYDTWMAAQGLASEFQSGTYRE